MPSPKPTKEHEEVLARAAEQVARKYGTRLFWADLRDLQQEAWDAVMENYRKYEPRPGGPDLFNWCYRGACWRLRMWAARNGGPVAGPRGRATESSSGGREAWSYAGAYAGTVEEDTAASAASPEHALEAAQLHALAERVIRAAVRRADATGLASPVLLGGKRPAEVAAESGEEVRRVYSAASAARREVRRDPEVLALRRRTA